jgi:hypothetical protein
MSRRPGAASRPLRQSSDAPPGLLLLRSKPKRGCRAGGVAPIPATKEIAVSESKQDRPDEADEKAPKPGEQDTDTVAGLPKKAPESKEGDKSKQDQ